MSRSDIQAFFDAMCRHDYEAITGFLADDVEWTISGPVDVLPFCGSYRGKQAVATMLESKVTETLSQRYIAPDMFLIEGDRGAALGRLIAKGRNGQTISYRLAQFFTLRDGKVVHYCSVLDSFDAAEQVIGHRIEVAESPPLIGLDEELFAV
jgi:ketosteroid isomerase-like protein